MRVDVLLEYNDKGCSVFVENLCGAFTRGAAKEEALAKLPQEAKRYLLWAEGVDPADCGQIEIRIVGEQKCELAVEDADGNALFPSERLPMDLTEYIRKKSLALKSAKDYTLLYQSIPQKDRGLRKSRSCFYGKIPTSANEMLKHTNDTLAYYAAGVCLPFDNEGDLVQNRTRLFKQLEVSPNFLKPLVTTASDGELWTEKKLLRRLLWHDRIHAKALYRRAITFWQKDRIADPFFFGKEL